MAKKAAAPATIEEKMQAALVPAEEQPYAVPRNWCWIYGKAFLAPMETKKPSGVLFRYIDIDAIDNKRQIVSSPKMVEVEKAPSRASRALHPGDTVFSMVRPYLKNTAFIDESIADSIASTGFYVCTPREIVFPKYNYYMMTSPYVVDGLNAFMKGDNSPSIRKEEIEQFQYPVPPLPEQCRIVDRIETMFAKLDEAKEKAQAVIDGYEDRRAAILHKAFTGELTAQIRAKKSVNLSSWKKTNLGAIVSDFKYGSSEKSDYQNTGTPVFRIPNIGDGIIDFDDMKYLSDEADETYIVHENDVLVIRSNGSRDLVGKCAIVPRLEGRYAYASFLIKIIPSEEIRPDFLVRFLNSSDARAQMFEKAKSSSGIHNINSKELGSISLMLPEQWEQEQIVTIIDDLLAKEAAVKDAAETTLATIDAMKQAILSRAFRGELGTNDPNDEPAEELLKRVLA